MRLFKALISVALVADATLASSWFNKAGKLTIILFPRNAIQSRC